MPIPTWPIAIEFHVNRPDKPHIGNKTARDWPLPIEKTPSGYGVVMTPEYRKALVEVLRRIEAHFNEKGWTWTALLVYQNALDEAGFHMSGEKLKAGAEQAKAIHDTAELIRTGGLKRFRRDLGETLAK